MTSRYTDEMLQLAAQPAAAERVLRLAADPGSSARHLARIIETDPALSARAMRLANSPHYGLSRRVASTRHAIVMLGFDTVRALAASAACSLLDGPVYLAPDGYWRHAVSTAAAASTIARKVGIPTDEAFSVGLLHDLGAALLYRRDAERFDHARQASSASRIAARELAAFGMTHARAGADALDSWGFPRMFVEVVALHQHDVELGTHLMGRVLKLAEAVALDHIPVPGYESPTDVDGLLKSLRLQMRDVELITNDIDQQIEQIADVLGVEP